jgi:DeoR/GlpR family transcriptional regulator of sugar metabolism
MKPNDPSERRGSFEHSAARRLQLLELLAADGAGRDLSWFADRFGVDERTIRRDVDVLQHLLASLGSVELRRGRLYPAKSAGGEGWFAEQLDIHPEAKAAIARAAVSAMQDHSAVALTAGSTVYYVSRELRSRHTLGEPPHGLIVLTNSLPVLQELTSAGIDTGVFGEVYSYDDRALHAHDYRGEFQPSIAVVGASGVTANPASGALELFSHRSEEAQFMRQLLQHVPEIIVTADGSKLGRRHPWAFTSARALIGKSVRLITDTAPEQQMESFRRLLDDAPKFGWKLSITEVGTHHKEN